MRFVSIHAPAWGATSASSGSPAWYAGFNPRTRVGCDVLCLDHPCQAVAVSIHAPAWGATRSNCGCRTRPWRCFNPRTRVGCDYACDAVCRGVLLFQSTHPRGVRRRRPGRQGPGSRVSIHAPAWGATRWACGHLSASARFNPRTRVGCDEGAEQKLIGKPQFQSTHPRGVRQQHVHHAAPAVTGFNPRTRVGCDAGGAADHKVGSAVSIHAPAWGATGSGPLSATCQTVFQSTHPRGVRLVPEYLRLRDAQVSIHAPAWGATCRNSGSRLSRIGFNPRTRVGCDPRVQAHHGRTDGRFNPRTRVGCDSRPPAPGPPATRFNPRTRVGCDQVVRGKP